MTKAKRRVSVRVLPGEPTDGTGRVCIHLFVQDPQGPFVEPHAFHPVAGADGKPMKQQIQALPTRGRLACDRRRMVAPVMVGNVSTVTPRTDDPRAVTCSRCKQSIEYLAMMKRYEEVT